jgi:hypothetical protein
VPIGPARHITSPELLIDAEPLPHLKCCRESVGGEGVMRRISMTTRDELIAATVARYALADRTLRSRIASWTSSRR